MRAMRSPLLALACILTGGWMFNGITFNCTSAYADVLPKIDCCFGSSNSAELAADLRKQDGETVANYDYSDYDPSPIDSHVHGAPIQNSAQAPSPAPSSSQSPENSTEYQLLPSPAVR